MGIYVGAYAASAALDRSDETALYQGLADMVVAGLEQPFTGRLHPSDDGWLLDQIRPGWTLVMTLLPGVMDRLKDDIRFGLASADNDGRSRAVDFAESARRTIEHMHRFAGRQVVRAVEIHSAPRLGGSGAKSSFKALARSLTELRQRDWSGASLLIEHCDAAVASHVPEKGFLGIEDELKAVKSSEGATPVALSINWGRSALETRSVKGPLEHIRRAAQDGLLGGLFFSGVAPQHPEYGRWRDSHVPFSTTTPESLLTPTAARSALKEAGPLPIIGLKLQTKPATMSVARRLAVIRDGLTALR